MNDWRKYHDKYHTKVIITEENQIKYGGIIGQEYSIPKPASTIEQHFERLVEYEAPQICERQILLFKSKFNINSPKVVNDKLDELGRFRNKASKLHSNVIYDKFTPSTYEVELARFIHKYYEHKTFTPRFQDFFNSNAVDVYGIYFLFYEWLKKLSIEVLPSASISATFKVISIPPLITELNYCSGLFKKFLNVNSLLEEGIHTGSEYSKIKSEYLELLELTPSHKKHELTQELLDHLTGVKIKKQGNLDKGCEYDTEESGEQRGKLYVQNRRIEVKPDKIKIRIAVIGELISFLENKVKNIQSNVDINWIDIYNKLNHEYQIPPKAHKSANTNDNFQIHEERSFKVTLLNLIEFKKNTYLLTPAETLDYIKAKEFKSPAPPNTEGGEHNQMKFKGELDFYNFTNNLQEYLEKKIIPRKNKKSQLTKRKAKELKQLFTYPELFSECVEILQKVEPPIIDVNKNFILGQRQKGSIVAWISALKTKSLIVAVKDEELAPLLNNEFPKLDLASDGRTLRNTLTTSYNKYYTKILNLLPQFPSFTKDKSW